MRDLVNYCGEAASEAISPKCETYAHRIEHQIKETEDRLVNLKRTQEILNKIPDSEELLSLLQRI